MRETPRVSRQAHTKEKPDGLFRKLKPYEVGVQISRRVHPEETPEDVIRSCAQTSGGGVPPARRAEGEPDRGRTLVAGSCAHVDRHSTQACGVASDWVHQREKRNSSRAGVWRAAPQFCWAALLGTG